MAKNKRKGYVVERKIRLLLEKHGYRVIRAGGSFGEADLICIKNKNCLFLQVKSSRKKYFYYYGYDKEFLEGFPFYVVVDFGYGKIRITKPMNRIDINSGEDFENFLKKFK
jgi:hypothetical protein